MAVYTDAFTNTAGTTLTTHNAKWVKTWGGAEDTLEIQFNQLAVDDATDSEVAYYYNDTFATKHYSKLTVTVANAGGIGPGIRGAAGDNIYYCFFLYGDKVYNGQRVASSSTDWDSGLTLPAQGTIIELAVDESTEGTIYYKEDGSVIATYTSKTALSGGRAGVCGIVGTIIRGDDWEGGDIVVAVNITLDAAAATATPIPLANINAPISRTLDTAVATAAAINLTVGAPPVGVAIILDSVTLTATCPDITVRGGHTVALDAAAATATGVSVTVSAPFAQTITLDTASLTASVSDITLDLPDYSVQDVGLFFPPFIDLSTASLTATGIGSGKIGLTVALDSTSLTVIVPDIDATASIKLDTAALTATPISTVTSPQQFITLKTPVLTATGIHATPAVKVALTSTSLMAEAIPLTVKAPVTIALDTAILTAEGISILSVVQTSIELDPAVLTATGIKLAVAEEQFISLDTAQLTAASLTIDATASILLDSASLTATGIALNVVPGAIAIVLDPSVATITGIPLSLTTGIIVFLETG